FLLITTYATHRDLHSFPTRRSSDLPSALLAPVVVDERLVGLRVVEHERSLGLDRRPELKGSWGSRRRRRGSRRGRARFPDRRSRDRKSTRLNSNHDQISYAVFCLKK